MRRFRPIGRHTDVSRQSINSQTSPPVGLTSNDHHCHRLPSTTSLITSRILLMPSPSSAFSTPPTRHNDTVPSTTCRNSLVDVPNTRRDLSDTENQNRRRRTVREMAQSYDRATCRGVEESTRRRPADTSTSESKLLPATTTETRRDDYTATSVFSLNRSRRHSEKNEVSKPRQTQLTRLYNNSNTVTSLDNFTRPLAGHVTSSTTDASELNLRRYASNRDVTESSHGRHDTASWWPLSSRQHSQSIQTLTQNTVEHVTASNNHRKHSWNNADPAKNSTDLEQTDTDEIEMETVSKREDRDKTSASESRRAEMRVVLEEVPRTASRCLIVRQSPTTCLTNTSTSSSRSTSRPTTVTSSLSLAFVSPRPIRKLIRHQCHLSSPTVRPTSAVAQDKFTDSDGQTRQLLSISPCKTLIELVRESHLCAFPVQSSSPAGQCSSSSSVTRSRDHENTVGRQHGVKWTVERGSDAVSVQTGLERQSAQPQRASIGLIASTSAADTVNPPQHHHSVQHQQCDWLQTSSSQSRQQTHHSSITSPLSVVNTPVARSSSLADQPRSRGQLQQGQGQSSQVHEKDSFLSNGFVTAALDSAIELLSSSSKQSSGDIKVVQGHETLARNVQLTTEEHGYDLLDEEPVPVQGVKPRPAAGQKSSERQVLSWKRNGCRTVKEELEAIERRRSFQLQRKDDSFDQPASSGDEYITSINNDPRHSVTTRHRRRRRRAVTARDAMTSSSSSRDTSPSGSSTETRQSTPAIAQLSSRRHGRLHDHAV